MNDPAMQAQIDAATAYEEFFVPALFQQWALLGALKNLADGRIHCGPMPRRDA